MHTSKIDGKSLFDRENWLVFLVDTAGASTTYFTGGHSALIIEGMTADGKIALGKYDFMATPFPRSTEVVVHRLIFSNMDVYPQSES